MSDVAVWNCEFAPSSESGGANLDALTVGARFLMKCHGDIAVSWGSGAVPKLVFAKPEDEYSLSLLKVIRQEPTAVEYEVTAYKAGEHAPEYVRVLADVGSAEARGFEFTSPRWKVASVLKPQQPPQPVPPFGPWDLSLPLWFVILVGVVVLLVVAMIVRTVRRFNQRRRMLEELGRHKTALQPLHQFYRDARHLRRRLHDAKQPSDLTAISTDLNREFRLYVLRRYQIPTLDWSNAAILAELRRRHRATYDQSGESLKRTLRELTKIVDRTNLAPHDVEQVHRMSLDTAERMDVGGGKR